MGLIVTACTWQGSEGGCQHQVEGKEEEESEGNWWLVTVIKDLLSAVRRRAHDRRVRVPAVPGYGILIFDLSSPRPRNYHPEIDNDIKSERLHLWHLFLA